tara:strand:- start:1482 stop:1904 length:423 start_codon:yes stop_codon:yes gene_type:complete
MKFEKSFGGREKYFPTKLKKDRTNDCVIRAIANATGTDYMAVFEDLLELSLETGHLPNHERTYGKYLEERMGWIKQKPMRNSRNKLLKVKDIECDKDLIVSTSRHLTYVNGDNFKMTLIDSWDCRNSTAYSYWERDGDLF